MNPAIPSNRLRVRASVGGEQLSLLWLIGPFLVTAFLWITSPHPIIPIQVVLVYALFTIAALAYAKWQSSRPYQLPVFAIIALMHALFFGVYVFWGGRESMSSGGSEVQDSSITATLAMAILGVVGMLLGMRLRLSARWRRAWRLPDVSWSPRRWWLIRAYVLFGIAATLAGSPSYILGEGWRQPLGALFEFIPTVAFLLLWQVWLEGRATSPDKVLIGVFLVVRFFGGIATGWVGAGVGLLLIAAVGYVRHRRRLPMLPVVAAVLLAAFLQAGKGEFRARYWIPGTSGDGIPEKVTFFVEASWRGWESAVADRNFGILLDAFSSHLVNRASLVAQAALIYEKTPEVVPYQRGATYRYLLVTFIPRFLWPGKPTASEANRFYQVAYGISQEGEDVERTAIGAGLIPEAYMNFGWAGVFFIMVLAGIVLEAYQHILLHPRAGAFASAVGLALILGLIIIEQQAAMYFGNLIQHVVFAFLAFWPVLQRKRNAAPAIGYKASALRFR